MIRIRFQDQTDISYTVLDRGRQKTDSVTMDSGDIMHVDGIEPLGNHSLAKVNVKADEWFVCDRSNFQVLEIGLMR